MTSTLVGAVSSTEFASGSRDNSQCHGVVPERELNLTGGLRYLHTPTLTETSVNPVENCHVEISPNSAHVDIMGCWDLMHANPTYEAGKEALGYWLSGQFEPLHEGYVGPGNFSLEAPIEFDQLMEDSLIAYGKRARTSMRIWNGVERKLEDAKLFLRMVSSRFQSQSTAYGNTNEPRCLSVFGMKATKTENGILASGPMLLQSTDSAGNSHKIVCQKRDEKFTNYWKPAAARRSKRVSDREVMIETKECDDWEFLYSQAGAISSFHLDSSRSGRFLHMISGVKVLCACPCSAKNWQVFQQYYRNMHDLGE
jgi:hypothetical protein